METILKTTWAGLQPAIATPKAQSATGIAHREANTPSALPLNNQESAATAGWHDTRSLPKMSVHAWVLATIAGDTLFVFCASLVAFWIRFAANFRIFGNLDELTLQQYAGYIVFGTITQVLTLAWMGVYDSKVLLRTSWLNTRIARGVLFWTMGFLAITLALKFQPGISRIYTALSGSCIMIALITWRTVLSNVLHQPSRLAALKQRTIFIGWNQDAQQLATELSRDASSGYNVVGWVNINSENSATGPDSDLPYLGSVEQLDQILASQKADLVIMADLSGPREEILAVSNLCEREMVPFKVIPSCFQIFASGLHLETVGGTPILGVDRLPLDSSINLAFKRLFDIIGALVGLALFTPVMAIFAAIVYIESPGSVIYRQRRMGLNGKSFEILKIRSMKLNAEKETGARWCVQDDPRRLRIGAFMRKTNIDELPQFWNVLKGEMSLVGPRPERPELIRGFKHQIPHYNARHNAKPGMTGWAQVNGLRGDTDLTARIQCDLWYLENWNIFLDAQIMLQTFAKQKNAY